MREITAVLMDEFCPPSDRVILDAGCGTGINIEWLKRYAGNGKIFGLDLVSDAISFCRERGSKRLVQASATDLPFANETFDLVTSFDVLVQIPGEGSDEKAISEMYRVLKPDGLAFVRGAAYEWMRSGHDEAMGTQRRYSLNQLTKKLEKQNFKILRKTYANTIPFPAAVVRRLLLKKIGLSDSGSDVKPLSPRMQWLNTLLTKALLVEARRLKNQKAKFPFGLSAICVVRK